MRVGIVLARVIVPILVNGFMRHEALQEIIVVFQKPRFVVVNVYACTDVHGIHQAQSFFDAALFEGRLNLRCDVEVSAACFRLERQFFAVRLHGSILSGRSASAIARSLQMYNFTTSEGI